MRNLKWLRMVYAEYRLGEIAGFEGTRSRLLAACLALNVPEEQILRYPGLVELCRRGRPRHRAAYHPDRAARPDPEPYYFGDDKQVWIEKNVEQYRAYLQRETEQADARLADAVHHGKAIERRVYPLGGRPRYRDRKLDLAEKYFVTVRRKILGHSYEDIAMDHVRPKPKTAEQMATAVNRLKSTVRAVWHEVCPEIKRSADR